MPITLNCPKCHKPFRVRDESIGGRVRCPSCAAILQVPSSLGPSSLPGFDDPLKGAIPPIDGPPPQPQGRSFPDELKPTPNPADDDDDLLGGPSYPPKMEFGTPGMHLPAPPSIKLRGTPQSMMSNPIAPASNPQPPQTYSSGSMIIPPIGSPGMPAGGGYAPMSVGGSAALPKLQSSFIQPPAQGGGAPNIGQPMQTPNRSPIPPVVGEWASARSGLAMVQAGLFLFTIPFLGIVGHGVWAYLKPEQALSNGPGVLGRPELTFWREIALAYTVVPAALGLLLLFFGRAKCTAVPDHSTARGLARAATFCTLLGVVGATSAAVFYLGLAGKFKLAPETGPLGICVAIPAGFLADAFTLFFIAQAGWAVGRPNLLLAVGTFLTFVIVAPAMMFAAHLFFPVVEPFRACMAEFGSPFAEPDPKLKMRFLIAGGILCAYGFISFAYYASLAGRARKAIRTQFGS